MSASDLIKEWTRDGARLQDEDLDEVQTRQLLEEVGIPLSPSSQRPGIELRLALERDPLFGPVIAFSYGRMAMDIWDDVTYRIVPLTPKDARLMVDEPRAASRLLPGYRSAEAPDVSRIEEAILKLSEVAQANPELAVIDLESVMAYPDGLVARTARVRLASPVNQ